MTLLTFIQVVGDRSEVSPPGSPSPSSVAAEFQEAALRLFASSNEFFGNATVAELERTLATPSSPDVRIGALVRMSREQLRLGEVDAAIASIEEATEMAKTAAIPEDQRRFLVFTRGLAYWRLGSVRNCLTAHNKLTCLFPIAAGGVHRDRAPALEARKSFEEYVRISPRDAAVAGWMLNLINMALGEFPQGVPRGMRLPISAFDTRTGVGRFEDMGAELKVNAFNLAGGVVADDFDGDGLLDIVVSSSDPALSLKFHRNGGEAGFVDATAGSGLEDQMGGLDLIAADYDDDGDLDLLVLRGAWLGDDGQVRNSLLRNDGNAVFADVTREAGLADPAMPTQAAAWGDFDNDGDLDLYVSNIGENRLYRNEGDLTFVDVAPVLGLEEPRGRSFATWWFDYDNDGWLDLFVVGYSASVADVAADLLGQPTGNGIPRLYRNQGDGTFADVTRATRLARPYQGMGANFGDFDNDGWLDMYLGTGDPYYTTLMPNVALLNQGGKRFLDVSAEAALGHLEKAHGTAFADFDNDGDQDVFQQRGGMFPGDGFFNALMVNPGHGHRFLTLALEGTRSNTSAIGARIRVVVRDMGGTREMHRAVGSVSSFGGSPFRQEIGLGDAISIIRLEVEWPASGTRQVFENVPHDTFLRLVEGSDTLQVVRTARFDLAAVAQQGGPGHAH